MSRPGVMGVSAPVARTTMTRPTPGAWARAASTFGLSGTGLPPRRPASAVTMTVDPQSLTLPAIDSGEKPPKTT